MVAASVLMFTFASLDVAFHLRHNLEAFIWFDGDPIDDFEKTSAWLNVIAMACYVVQTFIGDAILVGIIFSLDDRTPQVRMLSSDIQVLDRLQQALGRHCIPSNFLVRDDG